MTKKQQIEKYMNKLNLSEQEAKDLIEFDNATPTKQEEILTDLKATKKASPIHKVKTLKKKVVNDTFKEQLKNDLFEFLNSKFVNVQEFKSNQFGFMDSDGTFYSVKITKHKTIQDGYKIN